MNSIAAIYKKKNLIKKEFNPSITHSRYFIRKGLLNGIMEVAPQFKGTLLDFGCGAKPYESLFDVDKYIGLDFEGDGHSHKNEAIDLFYDGKTIPMGDGTVDGIFSSEVLEHIFNPEEILEEFRRVLKPNGKILITCPFVWKEHEVPNDYARYTQFALRHLFKKHGFEIIQIRKKGDFAQAISQIILLYILKPKLFTNVKILSKGISLIVNCIGIFLSYVLPTKWDFYLSNIVYAKKK